MIWKFPIGIMVAVILLLRLRKRKARRRPDSPLDLVIPLAELPAIDPSALAERLSARWMIRALCRALPRARVMGERSYQLTNGAATVVLSISDTPLPPHVTDTLLASNPELADAQRDALFGHSAYAGINGMAGVCPPGELATFALQILLQLLEDDAALGYVSVSAGIYRPKAHLAGYLALSSLDPAAIIALLTNFQQLPAERKLRLYGLEALALPDLEVQLPRDDAWAQGQALLGNCAIYLLSRDVRLQPGELLTMEGDAVPYRVSVPPPDPAFTAGRGGLIALTRDGDMA